MTAAADARDPSEALSVADALDAYERAVRACCDLTEADPPDCIDGTIAARQTARAAVLSAIDAAEQAAWHAGRDEGRTRGREAMAREVDEACGAIFRDPRGPGWNIEIIGVWPDDSPGTPWRVRACPVDEYVSAATPTAAILAAAAALPGEVPS